MPTAAIAPGFAGGRPADGEAGRRGQALPDDAVPLGHRRQPFERSVVGVGVQLRDDGDVLQADGRVRSTPRVPRASK